MLFTSVDAKDFEKVRASQWQVERLHGYAKELTAHMAGLFELSHIKQDWGTSFSIEGEGPGALLETPFGSARVVVVIGCAGSTDIGATYIFEKVVSAEDGRSMYKAVWAVRIDEHGAISTHDGKEQLFGINAISKYEIEKGVVVVALSAIYSIANDPGYFVTAELPLT